LRLAQAGKKKESEQALLSDSKSGAVVQVCNPSSLGDAGTSEDPGPRLVPKAKISRPYLKNNKSKKGGGVAHVVEWLTLTQGLSLEPFHPPSFVMDFFFFKDRVSRELFPWAGLEPHPPDLCLLSSWDYRGEPPVPNYFCQCFRVQSFYL
jgi:hypothetical protein